MTIKRFDNKRTSSPTERLTFKDEDEFESFCSCFESTAEFNKECLLEEPEEGYNKSLLLMLERQKRKREHTILMTGMFL